MNARVTGSIRNKGTNNNQEAMNRAKMVGSSSKCASDWQ